jgi:CheY-like chemotaxis protein
VTQLGSVPKVWWFEILGAGREMNPSEYTIIVVEDGPDEVFLFERALQKAGVTNPIQFLHDGQEAIDYLSRWGANSRELMSCAPPALMLLDLKMPRVTGLEVLGWLRAQPRLKRMVVVMMSSSGQWSDINRAYDVGCNSYLVKPVEINQFVELLEQIYKYWLVLNEKPDLQDAPTPSQTS